MLHPGRISLLVAALVAAIPTLPAEAMEQGRVIVLQGDLARDTVLRRKRTYVLQGTVVVRAGVTLRVQPGTTVHCDVGSSLEVARGGAIRAEGTAERPIVFTSAQPEAGRRRGDWTGITIDGNGGGDSSGALRYLRVEYAGYPTAGDGRGAALALRNVGSSTRVEYVEALNGDGDGVSVSGGGVNLRYVASVGSSRNAFVFGENWTGRAQFLLAQQRGDVPYSPYDGLRVGPSAGRVANVTIAGGSTGIGMRPGALGSYRNVVVTGCRGVALEAEGASVLAEIAHGRLSVDGAVLHVGQGGEAIAVAARAALAARDASVVEGDAMLLNPLDEAQPDFRPLFGSPTLDPSSIAGAHDGDFFVLADYVGAFAPEEGGDWLAGWSNFETPPEPRYLANAAPTPEDLARRFLAALADSNVPAIKRLRITKKEFCWYVWPELPASQLPNVSADFAWSQATLNSLSGLSETLSGYGGRRFELVSVRFAGGSESHETYMVHYDTRLVLRDEAGDEYEVKLFGSMLEQNGQFKLFSFVID